MCVGGRLQAHRVDDRGPHRGEFCGQFRRHVALAVVERRDVDASAIDEHVAVVDELARCRDGAREARAEHDVVEAPLEQLEQLLGRVAGAGRLEDQVAELPLAEAVARGEVELHAPTIARRGGRNLAPPATGGRRY